MEIRIKSFGEFTGAELYGYLQLRSEVFVVEQECVYLDLDGKDDRAIHIMGYSEDHQLQACTRIFGPGAYLPHCSIGRVAVRKSARGQGLGKEIMRASIREAERRFGVSRIDLSAQTYLIEFYRDLGFRQYGSEYLEDGIPHIAMKREA